MKNSYLSEIFLWKNWEKTANFFAFSWFEHINGRKKKSIRKRSDCVEGQAALEHVFFLKLCLVRRSALSQLLISEALFFVFRGPSIIQYEGASAHLSHLFSSSTNLGD